MGTVLLRSMNCDWLNLNFSFLRETKQLIKRLYVVVFLARLILIAVLFGFFLLIRIIEPHLFAGAAVRI